MNDQSDDHRIEDYLKSFRPLPPAPLPRHRKPWRLAAGLSAVAAAAAAGALLYLPQQPRPAPPALAEPPPITMGSANQLLAGSTSWTQAIDDAGFAFRSSAAGPSPVRPSALEFLSQEDLSK